MSKLPPLPPLPEPRPTPARTWQPDSPPQGTPAWDHAEARRLNHLDWVRHCRDVLAGHANPPALTEHDLAERRHTT